MDGDDRLAQRALEAAGVHDVDLVQRRGWSNWAWLGRTYVVRVSPGRLAGSLAHEHRVVDALGPRGIPVAPAVGSGRFEVGEWIVTKRLPGDTLAARWSSLDGARRRRIGKELGSALERLHRVDASDVPDPDWWVGAHERPHFHNAYKPHTSLSPQLAAAARDLPHADDALFDELSAFLAERLPLFDGDPQVLTHADIHGHNVLLVGDGDGDEARVHLLDWEGAHHAAPDLELDMLLRWTEAAHAFPERPNGPVDLAPGEALDLVDHVAEGYPALFAGPHLRQRLELHAANWHLVQVLFDRHWRDTHPEVADAPPVRDWAALRDLLHGRSHLDAFASWLGR